MPDLFVGVVVGFGVGFVALVAVGPVIKLIKWAFPPKRRY